MLCIRFACGGTNDSKPFESLPNFPGVEQDKKE